ncbi:hypothetical protein VCHA50O407_150116 [Vibrio chagasii]|nr:hypothetical protein VCHA50O407_150116 [Vibrio chagasii]CAH7004453.1 hypothetical protein VCHA50P424_130118 [Vibrio chagasii]CAH7294945.1 hypothetical protein VCHA40P240_40345 [Vibrio chagasii]
MSQTDSLDSELKSANCLDNGNVCLIKKLIRKQTRLSYPYRQ